MISQEETNISVSAIVQKVPQEAKETFPTQEKVLSQEPYPKEKNLTEKNLEEGNPKENNPKEKNSLNNPDSAASQHAEPERSTAMASQCSQEQKDANRASQSLLSSDLQVMISKDNESSPGPAPSSSRTKKAVIPYKRKSAAESQVTLARKKRIVDDSSSDDSPVKKYPPWQLQYAKWMAAKMATKVTSDRVNEEDSEEEHPVPPQESKNSSVQKELQETSVEEPVAVPSKAPNASSNKVSFYDFIKGVIVQQKLVNLITTMYDEDLEDFFTHFEKIHDIAKKQHPTDRNLTASLERAKKAAEKMKLNYACLIFQIQVVKLVLEE